MQTWQYQRPPEKREQIQNRSGHAVYNLYTQRDRIISFQQVPLNIINELNEFLMVFDITLNAFAANIYLMN